MASRTGARILVDQLLIQGVNHAFCVPGESYIGVLDALYDARDMIKLVVTRHESARPSRTPMPAPGNLALRSSCGPGDQCAIGVTAFGIRRSFFRHWAGRL
jgi:hypothetical protein